MAITATTYGAFFTGLAGGQFNLATDTLKVALVTSAYTFNQDTHDFWDDVVGSEVAGTNYTAGGKTITTPALTYDTTNNWTTLTADSLTWSALTATFRYAILYKSTGTNSTSRLITCVDYGANQVVTATDWVINFSSGVLRFKQAAA